MLVEEKELEYFKSAKKFLNSNPSEYDKSLEELNKITHLIKNITIIHMKALCWLMLSKFEDIIEFYYVNKTHLESIFNKDYNNNINNEKEKKEIKKIISLAFYNLGMRQKAKNICPEIKDNYKEERFELNIIQNNPINNNILLVNKDILKAGYLNSNRIDKDALLKNIINNLDSNAKNNNEEDKNKLENNLNTTKDLIPISAGFVDDLFNKAIENNKLKQLEDIIAPEETIPKEKENDNNNIENKNNKKDENKDEGNLEEVNGSIISKSSNRTNIYNKLKEEIELNYKDIQKEDGLLITFEEKMKENKINNDKKIENKDDEINKNNISKENSIDRSPENNKEEEKNKSNSNLNTANDLVPISTGFVDDLFNKAIEDNKIKQSENKKTPEESISKEEENIKNNNKVNNNDESKDNSNSESIENSKNKKDENKSQNNNSEGNFVEVNGSIISKSSNRTNVYNKLKEEIELNYNDIQKEDGLLVTFDEKIKDYQNNNDESIKNNDNKDKEINTNENNNENNNENENKNEDSNRSKKSEKQKEIKGPLNIQKIPFVKKYTSDAIQVNTKLKRKKEKINPENSKKEEIKEDLDEDKKDIEDINENKNETKNENKEEKKNKDNNSNTNNIQNEEIKEDEKINKEKNNDNNNFIKKSFTMNDKMNFINKDIHRIYPNLNNNDKKRNENQNDKANNKRISIDGVKSYNTYGFMNPIEFTLNPEEGSFKPISSASSQNEKNEEEKEDKKKGTKEKLNLDDNIDINDKKDEIENDKKDEQNINIDKNRALLRVEIDGEQIDLVHNDNPSRRNSKYGNYINIDYTEFSNQKRKKMIEKFRDSAVKDFDIKNQTQFQKTMKLNSYNLRGIKKTKEFSINGENEQNKTITDNSQSNLKKTCFYKTSYFLDKFDS